MNPGDGHLTITAGGRIALLSAGSWVPPVRGAVYWGPGYVGWVSTPTYVAWVPLAPGETYYGHGYYGPHSVNVTKVNVNTVVVKNVYKNVHVNNGVTVVIMTRSLRETYGLQGGQESFPEGEGAHRQAGHKA